MQEQINAYFYLAKYFTFIEEKTEKKSEKSIVATKIFSFF